jgi:hypothetical protein
MFEQLPSAKIGNFLPRNHFGVLQRRLLLLRKSGMAAYGGSHRFPLFPFNVRHPACGISTRSGPEFALHRSQGVFLDLKHRIIEYYQGFSEKCSHSSRFILEPVACCDVGFS